jgi:hypothetical protein
MLASVDPGERSPQLVERFIVARIGQRPTSPDVRHVDTPSGEEIGEAV